MYAPRSEKPFLDFRSGHSNVKNDVTTTCMRTALKNSCMHRMKESIEMPLDWLKLSWFPGVYLARLAKRVLQDVKVQARGSEHGA